MDEVYYELAEALRARHAAIADEESRQNVDAHMRRLQEISERLEKIEQRLPAPVDQRLHHFLQRRSYSKALEYLEEEAASS